MYTPDNDGINHINIYSKGKTELGKLLTNFAYTTFIFEPYGIFNSIEGFYYYYLTNCKYEELKKLHGYKAKEFGKSCNGFREPNDEDKKVIIQAIHCKLRQNKKILFLLKNNNLPLVHYYAYGYNNNYKIINQDKHNWFVEEFIRIQNILQQI